MALFKKREAPVQAAPVVPPMGSGRRLRTSSSIPDALGVIDALVAGYRESRYEHMPRWVEVGWEWNQAGEEPPRTVVAFDDQADDFVLAAFWAKPSGTEFGLIPLGSGDERLGMMPVIGHWKMQDASLSSIGTLPGGLITLTAPPMQADFLEDLLAVAGRPTSDRNVHTAGLKVGMMFNLKAQQFLATQNPRLAEAFVAAHAYDGGPALAWCQSILDDLVSTSPGLTPYVQGLPARIRAIMLESRGKADSFWNEFEA